VRDGESCECVCSGVDLHGCVIVAGLTLPRPGPCFSWGRCVSQYFYATMISRHLLYRCYYPRNSLARVLGASGRSDGRCFRLPVHRSFGCLRMSR